MSFPNLILYADFTCNYTCLTVTHLLYFLQHTVSLFITAIVTDPAYPSRRIKMRIYGFFRKVHLDIITYTLCRLSRLAGISTCIDLHSITSNFITVTHNFFAQIDSFYRNIIIVTFRYSLGIIRPAIIFRIFLFPISSRMLSFFRWLYTRAVNSLFVRFFSCAIGIFSLSNSLWLWNNYIIYACFGSIINQLVYFGILTDSHITLSLHLRLKMMQKCLSIHECHEEC